MKFWLIMKRDCREASKVLLVIIALLASITSALHAQTRFNSPYTRYGLGTLVDQGLNPQTMSMGDLHYGMQRVDLINPANPASYAVFDSSTFIFDAGVFGTIVNLRTTQLSESGSYISLSHLLFGFPVTAWWKTSFGVLPYSYVGYNVYNEAEIEGISKALYVYQGSGGLNQLYWGNAFKIGKKLSVGFNLKFLFGSINKERGIGFPDSAAIKSTRVTATVTANDIYGDIGIQYKTSLSGKLILIAGATFQPEMKISAKARYLATTYFGSVNSVQYYRDTIEFYPLERGNFILPMKAGAGFTISKPDFLTVGADFAWQNWEKYRMFGQSDSLRNSWNLSIGGEVIPNQRAFESYWQRVNYRLGFRYGETPLELRGQHLNEFGISFGFGFPIRRSKSTINVSLELGKRGNTSNNLIKENFIRFTLGVNIFENWFKQMKYF
jgi:hypothetical protein